MAVRELSAAGGVHPDVAWERYADPRAWSEWAPFIVGVRCEEHRLRAGLRGRVLALPGVPLPFEVEACDAESRRWRWRVGVGPAALTLDHEVIARAAGGTVTTLTLDGPGPLVAVYAPLAQIALRRLVAP